MKKIAQTIRSYISFIWWLLPDSLWRSKRLSLFVLLAGFLGIGFQVKVFSLIFYYARKFSSGEIINISGYMLDPRSSFVLLGYGSVAVVGLLSISVLCIYYSRRGILRIGRIYEAYCAKRVFYLLDAGVEFYNLADATDNADSYLFRLVKADSRFAGRILRIILSLIIPGITLLVTIAVLLYIDATLTLIIAAFNGVFLICQYQISKNAAAHSMRFERLALSAGREYRDLIQHFKYLPRELDGNVAMVDKLFAKGQVKKQLDAYEGRLRAVENSRLVSGTFMALVVGLIILSMGGSIIKEGSGWERLLIYVVALRFAMTSLQQTFSSITAVNRFYPQVRRYFSFVQHVERQKHGQHKPLDAYIVSAKVNNVKDHKEASFRKLDIRPGSIISMITPILLNRYTTAIMTKGLLDQEGRGYWCALSSLSFVTSNNSSPNCSLRRIFNLSSNIFWDDIGLPENIAKRLKAHLSHNIDKNISQSMWDRMEPDSKFFLSLMFTLQSNCQWLLMEEEGWHSLGHEMQIYLQALIKKKIVVFIHNGDFSRVGKYDEHVIAIMDNKCQCELGTFEWFCTVRQDVQASLKPFIGKKLPLSPHDDDDFEDDL